jgi:hypothetical protein
MVVFKDMFVNFDLRLTTQNRMRHQFIRNLSDFLFAGVGYLFAGARFPIPPVAVQRFRYFTTASVREWT